MAKLPFYGYVLIGMDVTLIIALLVGVFLLPTPLAILCSAGAAITAIFLALGLKRARTQGHF